MDGTVKGSDLSSIRRAAEFLQLRRSLRPAGIGSILFGVLALLIGLTGLQVSLINGVLVLIGWFLVIAGVWNLRSPTPGSMLADAVALFLVSGWNLFVGTLEMLFLEGDAASGAFRALFLGIVQAVWGVRSVMHYRRYAALAAERPSTADLARLESLVTSVTTKAAVEPPDTIDFEASAGTTRQHWRAKLAQPWAVFVDKSGSDVVVATPGDVDVLDRGEVLIGSKHKATLKIQDRQLAAVITPQALERIAAWKATPAA